jgi:cysteinyl-tRNA synthetase
VGLQRGIPQRFVEFLYALRDFEEGMIQFYNSLTRKSESFEPFDKKTVRMYSCGPTVYDFAHIGNFRSFLFADLLRRFLEARGYEVIHLMNITDVGHMVEETDENGVALDKMEVAAKRLKESKKSGKVEDGSVDDPNDPYQIANYYTKAFLDDGKKLGLKVASEYPDRVMHATGYIQEMIAMIEKLIANGHAYVGKDGAVYYSVESFPRYGQLSGNTLEGLLSGAGGRVSDQDQSNKKHPADFLLWKPDLKHLMKWDSPWGAGYPGWHIECSTMAMTKFQCDIIDIHTGGEDLVFPHHECEIAQSCGASGKDVFARFWMHTKFLLVEGEKMSKSKGNFYTVRDILGGKATGNPIHPAALRYELIRSHYSTQCNFTIKGLQDSANAVRKFTEFAEKLESGAAGQAIPDQMASLEHPIVKEFLAALADNLNISQALAVLHQWMSKPGDDPAVELGALKVIDSVLGITELTKTSAAGDDSRVQELCRMIDEARARKDYAAADLHRSELVAMGYEVRSSPQGTQARKKFG